MRFLIRDIKRGGHYVDKELVTHQLSIGRGPDQDIQVSSPRVGLRHAIIECNKISENYLRTHFPIGVLHNGKAIVHAQIKPGDILEIGNCKIAVLEPPQGFDCYLEVEDKRINQSKELESALLSRSNFEFANTGLRMRAWAWRLTLSILIFLFLIPLAGFVYKPLGIWLRSIPVVSDLTWSSGPISRAHSAFGNDCNTCHEKAFVSVRDTACTACHKTMPHHIEVASKMAADFSTNRCASCHKEHTDHQTFVLRDQRLCIDCHREKNQHFTKANPLNISNFADNHPEFRASLMGFKDGKETIDRVSLGQKADLKEHTNLEFSHKEHLNKNGIHSPSHGDVHLECYDCHELEKDGRYMKPVNFESHCHECHKLTFDTWDPAREVSHGDANKAQIFLQQFYNNVSFDPSFPEFSSTQATGVRVWRPGRDVLPMESTSLTKKAQHFAQGVTAELFQYRGCGGCHRVSRNSIVLDVSQPTWKIEPVHLAKQWFPKARFSHQAHQTMKCIECHEAESSDKSEDVMIKGIASCRQCHVDDKKRDKVVSTCIDCHKFHSSTSLSMSGEKLKASPNTLHEQKVNGPNANTNY